MTYVHIVEFQFMYHALFCSLCHLLMEDNLTVRWQTATVKLATARARQD